jgi:hypothetical protein
MRRAVSGRSKHFDKLLADHRAAKDAAIKLGKTVSTVPGVLNQVKIYRKHFGILSKNESRLIKSPVCLCVPHSKFLNS